MAVPVVEAHEQQYAAANATSGEVARPSGVVENDLLLLYVYAEGGGNEGITASGFTRLEPVADTGATANSHAHAVLWKIAGASEPSTYTASWSASDWWQVSCVRVSGVDTSDPIEGYSRAVTTSSVSVSPAVSVTTDGPDRLLIWSATNFSNFAAEDTWTPPSGWTNSGFTRLIGLAHVDQPASGTVSNITGSATKSGEMTATVLAVRPAVATETHRFYLANQPADHVPGVASAFLNDTTEAVNARQLLDVPTGVADSVTVTETSDSTSWWMLLGQWISYPATAAGTLIIDYDAVIAFSESTGAADFDPGLNVYVLQGDTTTELGTAVSRVYGQHAFSTTPTGIDLTPTGAVDWGDPVDFAAGDRIVVEVFARALTSATTPYGATVHIGGTSGTDLAGDDTDMSRPGWVDLNVTPGVTFEPTAATVTGTAAVTLGALGVVAVGTVIAEVVPGTASVSLGALDVAATGTRTTSGTATVALGGLVVAAQGTRTVTGEAEFVLGGVEVTANGVRIVPGAAAVPLGALSVVAVGTGGDACGAATITLGALEVSAVGTVKAVHTRPVLGLVAGTITPVLGLVADLPDDRLQPDGPRAPLLVAQDGSERAPTGPQAPLLVAQGSSERALSGPRVPALSAP